jgi:hypothetical protein
VIAAMEFDPSIYEVVVSRNGIITDGDFDIAESDSIALLLVPQGDGPKDIIRTVALLSIAIFAAPALVGSLGFASATGALTATGSMIAAGVTMGGALLINAILPPAKVDAGAFQTSQTYGWAPASNVVTQGASLPKVYGTIKVTPPLIGRYIETVDDKQYLHLLYALNDGELTSVSEIRINGESIDNFSGSSCQVTHGHNYQACLYDWTDTRYTKSVSLQLLGTSYRTVTTDGTAVTSLTVCLLFPSGLWYADNKGTITTNSVQVVIEYSVDGASWHRFGDPGLITGYSGVWRYKPVDNALYQHYAAVGGSALGEYSATLPAGSVLIQAVEGDWWYGVPSTYSASYTTITGSTTSAIRKTYAIKGLTPDQYQVRVKFYSAPTSDSRHGSVCYVEYIEETISDDFTYPNTALLAIKSLATDQLSGSMPTVTAVISNGVSNPADVVLSMLSDCGVATSRIDAAKFAAWRTECATKGYTCNIYFDALTHLRGAIDTVAQLGRARVEQFGSHFSVIADMAGITPTQGFSFGMGNILKDSFKQDYLPIADRANVLEVTFKDADNDYEPTVVEVSNEGYDTVTEETRVQINLIGCTNRDMAIRNAKYRLNCNRYLTVMPSWDADVDALVCRFGDIVQVSHDVPRWGESGRLVSGSTISAELDRAVTVSSGKSYVLQVRRSSDNSIATLTITNAPGTYTTLTFAATVVPVNQYDNYSFGEVGKESKLFRITSIGTAGSNLRRTLSAVEYVEDVYDDDYVDPGIYYRAITAQEALSLHATERLVYSSSGAYQSVLDLAWYGRPDAPDRAWTVWAIYLQSGSESPAFVGRVASNRYTVQAGYVSDGQTYTVYVVPDGASVTDTGSNTAEVTIIGKLAAPGDVTNFAGTWDGDKGIVAFSWTECLDIDLGGYEIREGSSWGNGTVIVRTGLTGLHTYIIPASTTAGTNTFWIKAFDTSGIYSSNAATNSVTISAVPVVSKSVIVSLYQWSATTPGNPSGTSTFTWTTLSNGTYTGAAGWQTSIPTNPGTAGVKLWEASKIISAAFSTETQLVSWASNFAVSAIAKNGATGIQGASTRVMFARFSGTPTSSTVTTSGNSSFPTGTNWGISTTWYADDPNPSSTVSLYTSIGVYNPSTGNTVWSVPYLASLRVASLEAITIYTGSLIVDQTLKTSASGRRVEVNGPDDMIYVYDGSNLICSIGEVLVNGSVIEVHASAGSGARFYGATGKHGVYGETDTRYGVWGVATGAGGYGGTFYSYYGYGAWCHSHDDNAIQAESVSGNGIVASGVTGCYGIGSSFGVIGQGTGYDVYANGSGTNYGPFTGAHDALYDPLHAPEIGDIVVAVECLATQGVSNTIFKVEKSSAPYQKGVLGVVATTGTALTTTNIPSAFAEWDFYTIIDNGEERIIADRNPQESYTYELMGAYERTAINAIGEGQINVCGETGAISGGDFIVTSSMPGKGMRFIYDPNTNYLDALSMIVAKVSGGPDIVYTFSTPEEVRLVPCIYVSG